MQTKDPKSADSDVIREIRIFAEDEPTITKDALQSRFYSQISIIKQILSQATNTTQSSLTRTWISSLKSYNIRHMSNL